MKKNIIHFAAAGIMAVSAIACSKELGNGTAENQTIATEPIILQASSQTKTHIQSIAEGEATIYWNDGDAISLISETLGGNQKLTTTSEAASATFTGDVIVGTTSFVAVYPYTSGASYSSGTITGFSIPTTQTATAGSFANGAALAMAKGTKTPGVEEVDGLEFKNLCSVISFNLPSNINASNIKVTAKSGAGIAGAVTIDSSTPSVSGASSSSIDLSGTFVGGNTYYVTIAPGIYNSGFNFVITTSSSNNYTLETTKDVTAVAGKIYPLGNLTLKLADADFTTSVALAHNVSSNVLNGTDAKLTINVNKAEFASLVSEYKYTVTIKDANDNIYRQSTKTSSTAPSNILIDVANSRPYMPKGTYNYTISLDYKVSNGTKDVTRHIDLSGQATSPQVSGFAIDANLAGHTSYDTRSNDEDGSTIYGIGASYKSGLSSDVYTQCSDLLSFKSTLDGGEKSGNQGSQSWASHTIGAKWSFDGASGTCASTKTVYVTGLPYRYTFPSSTGDLDNAGWKRNGKVDVYDNKICLLRAIFIRTSKPENLQANGYINSPGFYIPSSSTINVKCSYTDLYYSSTVGAGDETIYVNAVSSQTAKSTTYSDKTPYTAGSDTRSHTFNSLVFNQTNRFISISHNTTYIWAAVCTYYAIDIKIEYR